MCVWLYLDYAGLLFPISDILKAYLLTTCLGCIAFSTPFSLFLSKSILEKYCYYSLQDKRDTIEAQGFAWLPQQHWSEGNIKIKHNDPML